MNSTIVVGVQFLIILVIVLIGKFPASILTMALFIAGILLGVNSVFYMRLDNLRIFPEPKKNIRLVTSGPYKILRHPMYSSVLLFAASYIADLQSYLLYFLWFILLCVLLAKIRIEEQLLPNLLPEYSEYKKRTWKLIPFIF